MFLLLVCLGLMFGTLAWLTPGTKINTIYTWLTSKLKESKKLKYWNTFQKFSLILGLK